jgi:hypothetical protein
LRVDMYHPNSYKKVTGRKHEGERSEKGVLFPPSVLPLR